MLVPLVLAAGALGPASHVFPIPQARDNNARLRHGSLTDPKNGPRGPTLTTLARRSCPGCPNRKPSAVASSLPGSHARRIAKPKSPMGCQIAHGSEPARRQRQGAQWLARKLGDLVGARRLAGVAGARTSRSSVPGGPRTPFPNSVNAEANGSAAQGPQASQLVAGHGEERMGCRGSQGFPHCSANPGPAWRHPDSEP